MRAYLSSAGNFDQLLGTNLAITLVGSQNSKRLNLNELPVHTDNTTPLPIQWYTKWSTG